ncbi:EAL domain-containing protein [Erythrobacter sp. SCSIO 43205]|uniref:EAL domain-containing protein n=1 Tax=Erythrobacter sp. SCSIO 43205 TaxID=2779361 RepID=UPI001CA8003C|nr:EAL domain-containing protein [Erythrobacter sp. SCSIO 43205]UAB77342.1 EAL domain-containing protein [Erythrobacter sp. SCSIO 43205]
MSRLLSKLSGGQPVASAPVSVDAHSLDPQRSAEMLAGFEAADIGWFWESDAAGRLTYLTDSAIAAIGAERDALIGSELTQFLATGDSDDLDSTSRPLKFRLASRSPISRLNVTVQTSQSKEIWWEISATPRRDANGEFAGFHGTARDITKSLAQSRDSERAAQFDSLTGLANRLRMARKLDQTLTAFKKSKRSCAIMLLDLDRFKKVNDTLGHPAGDELLKQVATRIKKLLGDHGEIGRLGGDEFQILLPDMDDRGDLGDLSKRLVQMLSQPYSVEGSRAIIGCSIGIAVAPYDGIESSELVKAADLALYAAKDAGRGTYRFYSSELSQNADWRQRIEDDLRDALTQQQFLIQYQPIVDAKTHKIASLEALLRWEHPERGRVSPADFIPVAEELGIINKIGEWVLEEVCTQLSKCPPEVRAAVNVSPIQFASEDFYDTVDAILNKTGVDPARVELEITESVFVGDLERTLKLFKKLKKRGVRLSLDDFGTGYSSLSYLRDAPFDKIKIDQSFVRGCSADDNNNSALVSAIVSMARALKMETVAEGIETKDELAMVKGHGATHLQGYLFSGPISIDELLDRFDSKELEFKPRGPEKYRAERRTEFRKIGVIHGDSRYNVFLRNLSKTGARIEGLLDVPVGTDLVLDLGDGQLAVATVRRSEGFSQGVEFETKLISDGDRGLCTRHRVSPYQIEAAGRPLGALTNSAVAAYTTGSQSVPRAFVEVDMNAYNRR